MEKKHKTSGDVSEKGVEKKRKASGDSIDKKEVKKPKEDGEKSVSNSVSESLAIKASEKGEATVRDIEAGSAWQQGLAALRLEQDQWPASRDFTRKIPEEERSTNYASYTTCGIRLPSISTMMISIPRLMQYSDELRKVVFILACIMAA